MGDEKKEEVYVLGSKTGAAVIKYSGVYDFMELMAAIKAFLASRYYDLAEKEHTEAVKSSGKEMTLELEAVKKVTEYVMYKVNIKMQVYRNLDVVVETEKGKEKKHQGEIEIGVKTWMAKNYKKTFKSKDKSKFQEFLRQVYERFIGRKMLDGLKDKLTIESLSLVDTIKETINVPKR